MRGPVDLVNFDTCNSRVDFRDCKCVVEITKEVNRVDHLSVFDVCHDGQIFIRARNQELSLLDCYKTNYDEKYDAAATTDLRLEESLPLESQVNCLSKYVETFNCW